ncbi:MAG: hypothetical protein FWE40_07635 [Oscillospiraceae bacterium]|nr:hypothetical protein [Oscillospiraceae bacterium]
MKRLLRIVAGVIALVLLSQVSLFAQGSVRQLQRLEIYLQLRQANEDWDEDNWWFRWESEWVFWRVASNFAPYSLLVDATYDPFAQLPFALRPGRSLAVFRWRLRWLMREELRLDRELLHGLAQGAAFGRSLGMPDWVITEIVYLEIRDAAMQTAAFRLWNQPRLERLVERYFCPDFLHFAMAARYACRGCMGSDEAYALAVAGQWLELYAKICCQPDELRISH